MSDIRTEINNLWASVKRPNIDIFLKWLNESDFFRAPSSINHHGSHEGGLAEHTLMVYQVLDSKFKKMYPDLKIDQDSIIVSALGHDLCKVNFYGTGTRNVKDKETGKWSEKVIYVIEDKFPYGHGEKSVTLLQSFISVKPIERLAIRWHMGPFEPNTMFYGYNQPFMKALDEPLVTLLFTADLEASRILESKNDKQ
jgi:hypothetical protein